MNLVKDRGGCVLRMSFWMSTYSWESATTENAGKPEGQCFIYLRNSPVLNESPQLIPGFAWFIGIH